MARDGLDGLSAYEIAVARGFRGTPDEWLASLRGADGADGRSVDRSDVEAMVQAAVGAIERPRDGVDGKDGSEGKPGRDGHDGVIGKAATPSPVAHLATFTRDEETKQTIVMHVAPKDGSGQAWNVVPRFSDGVMFEAEIIPVQRAA